MEKKGQAGGGMMILGITIIIGVIILGIVFSFLAQNSLNVLSISNETVTLSDGPPGNLTGTLANDDLTTLSALRNITSENILGFCNITLSTAILSCNDTGSTTSYADYSYEPDGYLEGGLTRTIVRYITIMLALVLFTFIGSYIMFKK